MIEKTPKISVIVPMYNAEEYLNLCVSSILEQTFKDFELILIDDCSEDNTLEVAKSFKDSRIKLLQNKKNLGMPGAVRNIGIDAAKGEYIFFCDNDDVILQNGFEVLLKAAEENNADVVNTTKFYKSNDFKTTEDMKINLIQFSFFPQVSSDLKTRIYEEFLLNRMHIAPWLFLYKRKFLLKNNIKFPDEVAEDVFFNFDVVCATSRIIKIDAPFYIYRNHTTSTTYNAKRINKNMKSIPVLSEHITEKLAPLNDPKFTQIILMYWINHVMNNYIFPFISEGGTEFITEILKALEPRLGKNSTFVLTLMQLYFQNRLVLQENKILKNKLENIREIAKV